MHFRDLAPCTYSPGSACHDASWSCPLRAVGWLGLPFVLYRRGLVPRRARERLAELRERCARFSNARFRGLHSCSLCWWRASRPLEGSSTNLFVPGRGEVFVAPGRLDHYVRRHLYRPPAAFLEALERCPDPWSPEYLEALRVANGGLDPPLVEDPPGA